MPQSLLTQRFASISLALVLASLGGWFAHAIGLPLAWMIGAMLATTTAALAGAPVAMAAPLRTAMVAVLGIMLGSGFTPQILAALGQWSGSLSAVLLYIAASGLVGTLYFRKLCGYGPVTAYFSGMPGGLTEMTVVGSELGGDGRVISLVHASRILMVVLIIPFGFRWFGELNPAARNAVGVSIADVPAVDLAILGACGLIGFYAARALRIPAAAVVGPMIVSAIVHLSGLTHASPPTELVAAAQVAVGAAIGARFAGTELSLVFRTVLQAAGATVLLVTITGLFALALSAIFGLSPEALVLAFAPGGLAEMSLIAIALGADAAFVATHHIVRIFLIVVLAPLAFRLRLGRRG